MIENTQSFEAQIEERLTVLAEQERIYDTHRECKRLMTDAALAPHQQDLVAYQTGADNAAILMASIRADLLDLARRQYEANQTKTTTTGAGWLRLKATDRLVVQDEGELKRFIRECHMDAQLIEERLRTQKVVQWMKFMNYGDHSAAHLETEYSIAVKLALEE